MARSRQERTSAERGPTEGAGGRLRPHGAALNCDVWGPVVECEGGDVGAGCHRYLALDQPRGGQGKAVSDTSLKEAEATQEGKHEETGGAEAGLADRCPCV